MFCPEGAGPVWFFKLDKPWFLVFCLFVSHLQRKGLLYQKISHRTIPSQCILYRPRHRILHYYEKNNFSLQLYCSILFFALAHENGSLLWTRSSPQLFQQKWIRATWIMLSICERGTSLWWNWMRYDIGPWIEPRKNPKEGSKLLWTFNIGMSPGMEMKL